MRANRAVPGGTRVDRRLTFRFAPVLRPVEALLARRLPAEVRAELRAAKEHLEARVR